MPVSISFVAGLPNGSLPEISERIADQKFAVKALVTLYRHSSDVPGRTDTLDSGLGARGLSANPKRIFKRLRDGVRLAATTTTTAFGNVASEIAGRYTDIVFHVVSKLNV